MGELSARGRELTEKVRRSRADWRRWAEADSFADFAELTAGWLEGSVSVVPGYGGRLGERPDPETDELIPILAAACRAGFVTSGSQPGFAGEGFDGAHWCQRPAVDGFVHEEEVLARLSALALDQGMVIKYGVAGRRTRWDTAVPVSWREDFVTTSFGAVMSRHWIRSMYGDCPGVIDQLLVSWQVTIVDFRRGDHAALWEMLDEFSGRFAR
jgi:hypothetical protein